MKTFLRLPLVVVSLLLALPGHAAEREWIPYRKLVDVIKLDKFDALPAAERDKLILYAKLVPVNKALSPLDANLVVVDGASRTPLPLDASGRARMVLNHQWMTDDAQIWTSLPKGEKMRMGFYVGAVLPETPQWRYATVMGAIPQTNAAIGKVAGAMSVFIPRMKSVIFRFDKPAQLTIKAAAGDRRYATDAKHELKLGLDDNMLKENPLVEWSVRPVDAEIDD
jgi:hypothetical protein